MKVVHILVLAFAWGAGAAVKRQLLFTDLGGKDLEDPEGKQVVQ